MDPKYRVYEVVCLDPRVPARYIGYTSMTKSVFIACQNGIVRDKLTGKKVTLDCSQPSTLQKYIVAHGGWSNWDFRVFRRLYDSKYEANYHKERLIEMRPGVYSINIYKVGGKRAPPKDVSIDDDESILTEN